MGEVRFVVVDVRPKGTRPHSFVQARYRGLLVSASYSGWRCPWLFAPPPPELAKLLGAK